MAVLKSWFDHDISSKVIQTSHTNKTNHWVWACIRDRLSFRHGYCTTVGLGYSLSAKCVVYLRMTWGLFVSQTDTSRLIVYFDLMQSRPRPIERHALILFRNLNSLLLQESFETNRRAHIVQDLGCYFSFKKTAAATVPGSTPAASKQNVFLKYFATGLPVLLLYLLLLLLLLL